MKDFNLRNQMMTRLPSPYRVLHILQRSKGFLMETHSHDFYHVNIITEGYLLVRYKGEEYRITEGQAVILPPQIPHHLSAPDGYCQIGIDILDVKDDRGVHSLFCQTFPQGFSVITVLGLPQTFEDLYKAARNLTTLNTLKLLNAVELLLLAVIEQSSNTRNPNFRETFIHLVSTNDGYNLNLKQMCKSMNLSRTHLERLSHQEFGCGAVEYANKLKLMKACLLLQDTDVTLREIGDNLGFYDASHFNGFFKKRMDQTPNQYRNQSRQML